MQFNIPVPSGPSNQHNYLHNKIKAGRKTSNKVTQKNKKTLQKKISKPSSTFLKPLKKLLKRINILPKLRDTNQIN